MRQILGPALPWFDRRVDWRVDRRLERFSEKTLNHYARQENLNAVSDDVGEINTGMAEMLFTMKELRRWMIDNLDASADTAALLGETLTRLQTSVDRLCEEVGKVSGRLDALESAR
jgi:methyl-accepting chemotaxis protein